jgi:hypothetical protein
VTALRDRLLIHERHHHRAAGAERGGFLASLLEAEHGGAVLLDVVTPRPVSLWRSLRGLDSGGGAAGEKKQEPERRHHRNLDQARHSRLNRTANDLAAFWADHVAFQRPA